MFITEQDIKKAEQEIGIPNYGALGSIVDSRTYLRWVPELKRRETFFERNARVVNYNVGLALGYQDTTSLQEEADLLFEQLNNLKVWGSGRVAWVAGTKASDLVPEATMNCSASIVDRIEAFTEAFHLLCLGCGYGFRIYPEDVEKIPELVNKGSFVVGFKEYKPIAKESRLESTEIKITIQDTGEFEVGVLEVIVGDSRESWCSAIAILLQLYTGITKTSFFDLGDYFCFSDVQYVQFNFDNVRPEGERIAGFGGIASGPEPLQKLLLEFTRIIEEETVENKLRPINAMDMMCIMGDVVRSGNVRRSSLIALFHYLDNEVKNAKRGLWTDPKMAHKRYRSMSNNSILYDDNYKPSLEEFKELMQVIRFEGEPGFIRADKHKERRYKAALMWRPNEDPSWYTDQAGITNPCGEINLSGGYKDLKAGSYCNLVSIPVPDYISENGQVLWTELEQALRVVTRFAVRQTLINISLPLWDKTQKKERLLGVDLCGTWEAFDKMGVSVTSDEANELRTFCKQIANDEATKYSQELGIERPLLVTTGKPNGTYAQLRTIASGCHPPYAPFYIRRIRIAATDALAKTLIEQKIPYYPETSEWETYFRTNLSHLIKRDEKGNEITSVWEMLEVFDDFGKPVLPEIKTLVFEFPVKTSATRRTSDISAIEQLENYKMQMIHYIDHNQSVTVTVGDDEWDTVAAWFDANWDYVIGVSLLPKFADNVYPLLPYQECTEEEFNSRVAAFPEYPLNVNMDLLNRFELEIEATQDVDDIDVNLGECSTGMCPVR